MNIFAKEPAGHRCATEEDIRALLGDAGEEHISALLATGASVKELERALIRLDEDASLGFALDLPFTHRMEQAYRILKARQDTADRYML